jgi:D-arabinose 1-dehydrogenase-like Zn-dependent alcohol dehydrogenase
MAIKILRALGGVGAVVVDLDPVKRETAIAAGALAAIDGTATDAAAQIQRAVGSPCLSVIDLVGSPQTAGLGFDCLTKGGMLVLVGLFGNLAPWPLAMIPLKAISIVGNLVGSLEECRELIDLVRAGRIEPIPVSRVPLDDANDTLMALRDGKFVGRAVLCP